MNTIRRKAAGAVALGCLAASSVFAGTLYIGSDTEDFANIFPDHLVVATVNGAAFVSQNTINLNFHINGLGDAPGGILYAGTPSANTLYTIDYSGNILSTVAAPGIPNGPCCNEELQLAGGILYHAHFTDEIEALNPATGALLATYSQADIVGMALVGNTLWISKWAGRTVGTWNPLTNLYTAVFSTPNNAGGLAYDPVNAIIWVGMEGGTVTPYSLAGAVLGASFQPFGNISDTIDGLTFQGEGSQTPEPATFGMLALSLIVGVGVRNRFVARG